MSASANPFMLAMESAMAAGEIVFACDVPEPMAHAAALTGCANAEPTPNPSAAFWRDMPSRAQRRKAYKEQRSASRSFKLGMRDNWTK